MIEEKTARKALKRKVRKPMRIYLKLTINYLKLTINYLKLMMNYQKLMMNYQKLMMNYQKSMMNYLKSPRSLKKVTMSVKYFAGGGSHARCRERCLLVDFRGARAARQLISHWEVICTVGLWRV
jgi:hypothetical protein